MTPQADAAHQLALQLSLQIPEAHVRHGQQNIHAGLIAESRYVREANFRSIHPADLEWLFQRYDEFFFNGACRLALLGRPLRFRLSPRMTTAGGKTSRFTSRAGEKSYEIAIASSMLFDGFRADHRTVTAWKPEGPTLRLHIGLEDPKDLLADLGRGFDRLAAAMGV